MGSALCYWVLTITGKVVARTTVQHATTNEVSKPVIKNVIRDFHNEMNNLIGSDEFVSDLEGMDNFINDDVDAKKLTKEKMSWIGWRRGIMDYQRSQILMKS